MIRPFAATLALAALSACGPAAAPEVARLGAAPELAEDSVAAPADAPPGSCWARDRTPQVLETVTVQAPEGTAWRTETEHRIAGGGEPLLFQTPCAAQMTPDLISSLQRALAARGLYRGPVSGQMDAATRSALRRWQKRQGHDSAILALETAMRLGLIAYGRPGAPPPPPQPLPAPAEPTAGVY